MLQFIFIFRLTLITYAKVLQSDLKEEKKTFTVVRKNN